MRIDSFEISNKRTFIIAEIGHNHQGSTKKAKEIKAAFKEQLKKIKAQKFLKLTQVFWFLKIKKFLRVLELVTKELQQEKFVLIRH